MSRTYDSETMQYISLFETLTQTRLKDCIKDEEGLTFVVMPGYIAKAIGKGGVHVKKLQNALKKNIQILEFNENPVIFVKNMLNLRGVEVEGDEHKIVIRTDNPRTKGQVYGRDRSRLTKITSLLKRYFPIEKIVVE